MVSLDQTSLPAWAHEPRVEPADPAGRVHTLLAVGALDDGPEGAAVRAVATGWQQALGGATVHRHDCADAAGAAAALHTDLATARVGHRVLVAGSADACLAVRAVAVRAGLADDELRFGVVAVDRRTVWCVHCSATTTAAVEVDAVVTCPGCARSLLVYAHVSRRTGRHLGFMVDAEDQPWEVPA
ncbi:dimethylamine monooxygenase subunit DmmA family protein [Nocardioides sp. CPCC 205120]|uniref:dimethylamine monooxygenase subunit DmmA family protein n=1 Tax=Nocardioides sp. CPCC 205120 TaxID=3406462 RepID=UPI003B514124